MKNLTIIFIILSATISLQASTVSQKQCNEKGENFIFAANECINYFEEEGDEEGILNIIVHGAWPEGTNTLARYSAFASNLNMNTDITTIAFALPGYSKSSQNTLEILTKNKQRGTSRTSTKQYVKFLGEFISTLKEKYNAQKINLIAHSAGAMMSASLSAYKPNLIQNILLAGGVYKVSSRTDDTVTIYDLIDKIGNTNYLLVYGSEDKISKPKNTKDLYLALKAKKINAKLLEVKGHAHIDLDMSDKSVEGFSELISSE